jgi:putative nucleotidyltransferase with HDIG domain
MTLHDALCSHGMRLPPHAEEMPLMPPQAVMLPPDTQHILIVEDEPALCEAYAEALGMQGYAVLTAANGEDALHVLESNTVDLVLSDLKMPRMGGEAMLREITLRGLSPAVIFLTGYGTIESAVNCLKLGAADYLLKPFDMHQLFKKIVQVLTSRLYLQSKSGRVREIESFSALLRDKKDSAEVFKALLSQVQRTLAPNAMALFSCSGQAGALSPLFLWGPSFRECPQTRNWLLEKIALVRGQRTAMVLGPQRGKRVEDLREEVRLGSAAVVPIVGMRGVYGVLALGRDQGSTPYTREDLRMLNVYTGHAAPFLESILSSQRFRGINAEVVTSYARAVEAKDIYTRGHSERVSGYATLLGQALGVTDKDLEILRTAGILHDIGKIGIPDDILNKPSGLTPEEFEIMKRHPVVGRDIISRVSSLEEVVPLVYHHHEWFNGQGYPTGKHGADIPLLARILSVADGFEALTSNRSYHEAMTVSQAKQVLSAGAGRQWDPEIVDAWVYQLHNDALPILPEFKGAPVDLR